MSQTLTKPILLDETGQAIKTALQNIDETEAQDWLLTYEDVHSEMDDNIASMAESLSAIKDILESGEWYPSYIYVSYYPDWTYVGDTFDITKLHVYVFMNKEVKESYIVGEDTKQIDITDQCELSHKNGDVWTPDNNIITASWTYGKTGITYTATEEIRVYIPTFADSSLTQLQKMLDAHYAGAINIHDYWSVGDERQVNIKGVLEADDASDKERKQYQTLVLMHEGGKTLTNGNECAFIVGFKELLGNTTNDPNMSSFWNNPVHIPYDSNWSSHATDPSDSKTYTGNWEVSSVRDYLNNTLGSTEFLTTGSSKTDLMPLFKEFYNVTGDAPGSETTITTVDKFALPSMKEVSGLTYYVTGDGSTISVNEKSEQDLFQFDYYKTSTNRYKRVVTTIASNTFSYSYLHWWTRSVGYYLTSDGSIYASDVAAIFGGTLDGSYLDGFSSNPYPYDVNISTRVCVSPFGCI